MKELELYTIGFTQKDAKSFFSLINQNHIQKVIDVRLKNNSQLSGFAKARDLPYFLKELAGVDYYHADCLAPTSDILDAYKKYKGDWSVYEYEFMNLMEKRQIEKEFSFDFFDAGCLLCSEHKPHHCHRRLVVDYLNLHWGVDIKVKHLF